MTTGALDLPDTSRLEVDDAKDELRKVLRAHRRAHHHHPDSGHTAACEALTEHALEAVAGATTVATFVSMGAEPCTRLLLERLHEAGVEVLLPVLGPHLARCWGRFQGSADLAERAPRRPLEPSGPTLPAEAVHEAEALLVPALCVDRAPTSSRSSTPRRWWPVHCPWRSTTSPWTPSSLPRSGSCWPPVHRHTPDPRSPQRSTPHIGRWDQRPGATGSLAHPESTEPRARGAEPR